MAERDAGSAFKGALLNINVLGSIPRLSVYRVCRLVAKSVLLHGTYREFESHPTHICTNSSISRASDFQSECCRIIPCLVLFEII